MKNWIKHSLVAASVCAVVFGGAAYARGPFGDGERSAHMVERIGKKLELTDAQKPLLDALGQAIKAQREALKGNSQNPADEFKALIAGAQFDRAAANNLLTQKTQALQTEGPKVIAAMADFYDSLTPAQQQQLREQLEKRGKRGDRGERGDKGDRKGEHKGERKGERSDRNS